MIANSALTTTEWCVTLKVHMIRSPRVRTAAWALRQVWSLLTPSSLCIWGSLSSCWNTSPVWTDRSSDQMLNSLAKARLSVDFWHGVVYPLSWTVFLKLFPVLLAAFGIVTVVIQAFPQLVSGGPAQLPLCGVWSRHRGPARPRTWTGLDTRGSLWMIKSNQVRALLPAPLLIDDCESYNQVNVKV